MAIINGTNNPDILAGTGGDDTITGRGGNDIARMGSGNDRFVWNAGDGSDTIEGEAGTDSLQFNGAATAETIQLFANAGRLGLMDSVDAVTLDMNGIERLNLRAAGGSDTVSIGDLTGTGVESVTVDLARLAGRTLIDGALDAVLIGGTAGADAIKIASSGSDVLVTGLAASITVTHASANDQLTINAGVGDDVIDAGKLGAGRLNLTINGGSGNDSITGSAGNDLINGGQGNDVALMGTGDDRFVWNPGDGSDIVNGQAGFDTMAFNGSNIAELINITANGTHTLFTRNIASIAMDLESVERIEFRALGGADTITIGDLTGTGVKQIALDLGALTGEGDAASDSVTVSFSNAKDTVKMTQAADGTVSVTSATQTITIAHAEAGDRLTINGLGGNDTLDATALKAGAMTLTLDGATGNDLIFGGAGVDTLLGGEGNDTITWSIGGGNDVIDGQNGIDTLVLNGGAGNDTIQVFDNLGKLGVSASDGALFDTSGMELVRIDAKAGSDTVVVGDLGATDIDAVTVDLGAGKNGKGDGSLDTVFVQSGLNAVMTIATAGGRTTVTNAVTLQTIAIEHADATDVLRIQGSNGNDVIQATAQSGMALQIIAGAGADTIFSGAGNDVISGGQGNDVALMGAGNDRFTWNPGDGSDTIDGQAGFDTLTFNGSNIGEVINILADGKHAEMTRNVASVTTHLDNVERIEFQALGGADNIHVHDLGTTTVKQVAISLAALTGTGDGAFDTVTVDGTGGNDQVKIASSADTVTISGLPAQITITHGELDDEIVINGGGGDDTIDASGLQSNNAHLKLDGGSGNDTLIGGQDGDLIFGGDGHDLIRGGSGVDTIDGGIGNDTIIGGVGDDVIGGGDGADTFIVTGMLDGRDLIEGFTSEDRLNLTQLFDSLGVAAGDRGGRVSLTDNGFGDVNVAIDADGNQANGFEHVVAILHTNSPITVGQEVIVNG